MNTTAVAVAACVLSRKLGWPRWARRATDVAAVTCVGCEAISRLARGSHWLSDVAPSALLGLGCVLVLFSIGPRIGRRGLLVAALVYGGAYLIFASVPSTRLQLPSAHESAPVIGGAANAASPN
jgi:hypothetical protein